MPNMEQEFRAWLLTQKTKFGKKFNDSDADNFAEDLNAVMLVWIGRRDSLFNETDIESLKKLHKRCGVRGGVPGDLYDTSKGHKSGRASNALGRYIKFLKSRNTQNDFSNTNMEQDFRAWLLKQEKTQGKNTGEKFTEKDVKKFADALNEVIPKLIGRSDTLFNETNVDVIEGLLQQFLKKRDQKDTWAGLESDSLSKYKKFLESRNTQNDFSKTTKEGKTMKKTLNQILYGPPGTGKTYSTVREALEVLGATDEQKQKIKSIKQLKEKFGSRIEFVTFHQSFSYEDFVEGLKAEVNDDGNLTYETQDGIFKIICEAATNAELTIHSSESQEEADDDEDNDSIKQFYEVIDKLKKQLLEKPLELELKKGGRNFTLHYNDESGEGNTFYAHSSVGKQVPNPISVRDITTLYKNPDAHRNTINNRGGYISPLIEYLEKNFGLQKYQATEKPKEQQGEASKNDSLKQFREKLDELKEQSKEGFQLKTLKLKKPFTLSYIEGKETFHVVPNTEKQSPFTIPVEDVEKLYKNPNIPGNSPKVKPGGIHYKSYVKTIVEHLKERRLPDYQENNSDTQPHQEIEESKALENEFELPEYQEIKEPHVLIIDEINRGNISRILGELITLIEPSKRAGADEEIEVTLPYSKESFSVPDNLYIIGTMNTADRSLAQIDIALRRRFRFVEMMPDYRLLSNDMAGVNLSEMLEAMNNCICRLLDREHQIGHSFFMKEKVANLDDLKETFQHEILPLLEEYFFENWENILEVLNDKNVTIFYTKIPGNENSNTPYRKLTADEWDELNAEAFKNIYKDKGINVSE